MCTSKCLRFVSTANCVVEELPWGPHEWLVRPDLTEGRDLLLVRVTMPPGEAHQFHRHPHQEEALYYLEGRAEQWVGEEELQRELQARFDERFPHPVTLLRALHEESRFGIHRVSRFERT